MALARRVVFLDDVGYNYLQRPGSIMQNKNLDRNREILLAFEDLLGWFRQAGLFEAYRQELCYLTLFHAYLAASVRVALGDPKHPLLPQLRQYLRQQFPDYRRCRYLPQLGRSRRLLLSLLDRGWYPAVRLLFQVKGRLG